MLTVVCVYRPGGGFSPEYVYRLERAVRRSCRVPFRFICLTNQSLKVTKTLPLLKNWIGYWSKLELFRKGNFNGPVAYFDLDTAILNDITDILSETYEFAAASSWKGHADAYKYMSSSVMLWDGTRDFSHLYEKFDPKVIPEYEQSWRRWGDQAYIGENIGVPFENLLARWPGRFVHTKTHVWGGSKNLMASPPKGASVVAFSGRPRPHQLPSESPLYKAWVA